MIATASHTGTRQRLMILSPILVVGMSQILIRLLASLLAALYSFADHSHLSERRLPPDA